MKQVIEFLNERQISFETNIPLSRHTWIKTGGETKIWVTPQNLDELISLLKFLYKNNLEYDIVGHTSNLYYLDSTNPSIVITTKHLREYVVQGCFMLCDCGVPISALSRRMVDEGYIGYSGFVNLPGTVGAASVNNSGCFGCVMSELVDHLIVFNKQNGQVEKIENIDMNYGHRTSSIKCQSINSVVLQVALKIKKGTVIVEQQKAIEATTQRRETQEPPAYTLGSVFANLVERNSLGYRIYRRLYSILANMHILSYPSRTHLLLSYYRYTSIEKYVSQKNVNTFIWLPNEVEKHEAFKKYCEFMNKAFVEPKLEIEIR